MGTNPEIDASSDPREAAQHPPADVIRAAGGLLWRQTADGPLVAVVHRTRYGGEWSLPKGKLQPGESWRQAAIREVNEETGCDAEITGLAGPIAYMVGDVPKVVVFWHMSLVGECVFRPSAEVDRLGWLSPGAAAERVRYAEEKRLLAVGAGP